MAESERDLTDITLALVLGCEFDREGDRFPFGYQPDCWVVRLPGAKYFDRGFKSKGDAARAALLVLQNPPEDV